MLTILSQNTNDNLRDKAYKRLRDQLPTWEGVLSAPVSVVAEAIKIAGLSQQKAARMKEILGWIQDEFGKLSLAALRDFDDDTALKLLTGRKGIGIKTAAVVLMATMGRDLCPVDTHVHRISKRLGWINDKTTAEKTFWQLRPHIPAGQGHSLHMNLLQFGRTICQARKPDCGNCFMWNMCVWEGKGGKKL
jgi:endonuclease-3